MLELLGMRKLEEWNIDIDAVDAMLASLDKLPDSECLSSRLRWIWRLSGLGFGISSSPGTDTAVILDAFQKRAYQSDFLCSIRNFFFPRHMLTWRHSEKRYGMVFERVHPDSAETEAMIAAHGGDTLFMQKSMAGADECCETRKGAPLKKKLGEFEIWGRGRRQDPEIESRKIMPIIQWDPKHPRLLKLNPVADWSKKRLWQCVANTTFPIIPCLTKAIGASVARIARGRLSPANLIAQAVGQASEKPSAGYM